MTKVILDSTTSAILRQLSEQVELVDESGIPLGTFIPAEKKRPSETPEIPLSIEELKKRSAGEPGGRSLAEILADLEKMS